MLKFDKCVKVEFVANTVFAFTTSHAVSLFTALYVQCILRQSGNFASLSLF